MKSRAVGLTAVILFTFFIGITGVYSAFPSTSDLVIYHKFDGDLSDEEGGNDFIDYEEMFGGTTVYSDIGTNNLGAISAADHNIIFEKDTTGVFPSGDWDITFTLLPNSVPVANGVIAMFGDDFLGDGEAYVSFELRNGDGTLDVYAYNPANLGDSLHLTLGNVIVDELNLVRLSFDSDTELLSGYLNNMTESADRGTFTENADFSPIVQTLLILGGESLGGPVAFDGYVANFGVFDVNQSDEYFDDVYNAGDVQELNRVVTLAGSGTELDPYLITSCEELVSMSENEAFYELTDDIDCSGEGEISPLFNDGTFYGNFDGNDFEISGLDIVDDDSVTGLFSYLDGATIYALDISGEVTGAGNETGSLVGRATNGAYIANVASSMTVNGDQYYVGGIIGSTEEEEGVGVTLAGSTFTGTIYAGPDDLTGVQAVGGLVGSGSILEVSSSAFTGSIIIDGNDTDDVGGGVGYCEGCTFDIMNTGGSVTITNSSWVNDIGGIVGSMSDSSLTDSQSGADLIIGSPESPINGVSEVGGAVGMVFETSTFDEVSTDQAIIIYVDDLDFGQYIGGIAGIYCVEAEDDISLCDSSLTDISSSSTITIDGGGISQVGGLMGTLYGSPIVGASFDGVIDMDVLNGQFIGGGIGHGLDLSLDEVTINADIDVDLTEVTEYMGSIGGLIGSCEWDASQNVITDSSTAGTITIGEALETDLVEFVGGIIGNVSGSANFDNIYSTMNIQVASSDYVQSVAGLIGYHDVDNGTATLDIAYYYGDLVISALTSQFTGGLYGYVALSPGGYYESNNAFTAGLIEITGGSTEIGGLYGYVEGDDIFAASNMYSVMDIDGFQIGGLFGAIDSLDAEDISVSDMFVAGDLTGPGFASVAYNADPSYFSEIYYDTDAVGSPPCMASDESEFCIGIDGSDGYFKGNSVDEPMGSWTFDENFWAEVYNKYPHLTLLGDPFPNAPNDIEDFTIVGHEVGDYISETQPTFTFTLTDNDEGDLVLYQLLITDNPEFSGGVMGYISGFGEQGEFEFTVGQAEGDGEYNDGGGGEDSELEDGTYYMLLAANDEDDNMSNIYIVNDGEPAFIVDTVAPVLTEVTPIDEEIDSDTAEYFFSIEEENDYEYSLESCSDGSYEADISDTEGEGSVSFVLLEAGSTYECDLVATDVAGNESNTLTVGPFTVAGGDSGGGSHGGGSHGGGGSTKLDLNKATLDSKMTYQQEVERVMDEKVVTENPEKGADKCEALIMMSRVFKWNIGSDVSDSYSDTPDWCKPYAAFATKRGIVTGRSEGVLGLDTPVSRYEIAVMLERELGEIKFEFTGNISFSFSDSIIDWAQEAVYRLAKEGILKGFADGSFGGEQGILKQDLGVVLLRIRDRL